MTDEPNAHGIFPCGLSLADINEIRRGMLSGAANHTALADLIAANHAAMTTQVADLTVTVRQINGRIRALESWRAFLAGGVAVLIFMVGMGAVELFGR